MITTDFVPGSPAWLDLGTPDLTATARFYGAVFGWEFRSEGPAAGAYGLFRLDGKVVAGLGRLTEDGARSAWMLYFHTQDAEAVAESVRRLGGAVRMAPGDAGEEGRLAQFTDPQGGQFAVWQPLKTAGVELVDQPGGLCWTELYTTDAAGAKEFYGGLFGWTTQDIPMPGGAPGTYSMLVPAGCPAERMHGGLMELPPEHLAYAGSRATWHPVFASADCDATVARVKEHGGSVLMEPEDVPGVGRLGFCMDPAGADFVVLRPE
ncbi:VOC family protein [Peterkaempfera griseoplana]|uniref:VOC family protein n=1 Tax=Peterkaempfera griseoplana TaxID=66896 RepID=UPI0006E2800D|nr:VOC family protein [Peterkaempfera griseoplana]